MSAEPDPGPSGRPASTSRSRTARTARAAAASAASSTSSPSRSSTSALAEADGRAGHGSTSPSWRSWTRPACARCSSAARELPGPAAPGPAAAAGPAPARADADAGDPAVQGQLVGVDVLDHGGEPVGDDEVHARRAELGSTVAASSPSSVMIRSSDCARAHGQQRRALELRRVQQPDLRRRRARRRVERVRQRAARRRQPVLERDPGGRDERRSRCSARPGSRPSSARSARACAD